jgi:hypothetical protein
VLRRHRCRAADHLTAERIARPAGDFKIRREAIVTLYVVLLAAVVVAVDFLFFRNRFWFWERLMANIGIVLVFAAFYLRFLKRA